MRSRFDPRCGDTRSTYDGQYVQRPRERYRDRDLGLEADFMKDKIHRPELLYSKSSFINKYRYKLS